MTMRLTLPLLILALAGTSQAADVTLSPGTAPPLTAGNNYLLKPGAYTSTFTMKDRTTLTVPEGSATIARLTYAGSDVTVDGLRRGSDWRSGYGLVIAANSDNKRVEASGRNRLVLRNAEVIGRGVTAGFKDDGWYGFGSSSVLIERCYLHDFGRAPFIIGANNGMVIRESWIAYNESIGGAGGSHSEAVAFEGDDNLTIENCIFEDIEGTGFLVLLSRGTTGLTSSSVTIRNCIFWFNPANPRNRQGIGNGVVAVINGQIAQNWKIDGNLFAELVQRPGDIAFSSMIHLDSQGSGAQALNSVISGNIWLRCQNPGWRGGGWMDGGGNKFLDTATAPIQVSPAFWYDPVGKRPVIGMAPTPTPTTTPTITPTPVPTPLPLQDGQIFERVSPNDRLRVTLKEMKGWELVP